MMVCWVGYGGFRASCSAPEGGPADDQLVQAMKEQLAVDVEAGGSLGSVKHAYTHFRVTLEAWSCEIVRGEPAAS